MEPLHSDVVRLLYETVHKPPMSLQDKGDLLGVSDVDLSRYTALHENTSGRNFPLPLLVPLMRLVGDYRVLRKLAQLCGFELVRPTGPVRARSEADLPAFWKASGDSAALLAEAYANPADPAKKTSARDALTRLIEEAAGHRKALEKSLAQEDLNL